MMTIGITGATGFLGFHLRAFLLRINHQDVLVGSRTLFEDKKALDDFVRRSDVIIHLAAETRGEDREVYEKNTSLTQKLVEALKRFTTPKPVVVASTVQVDRDTGYGRSKKEAGEALLAWGKGAGVPVSVFIIPNIFGEFARPFHNSVIATFCTELIADETSTVNESTEIRLVHAQDVSKRLYELAVSPQHGKISMEGGDQITVGELYQKLSEFKDVYSRDDLPNFANLFERRLFNVYRSALPLEYYPRHLMSRSDSRGDLIEIARVSSPGQVFYSTTNPGYTRGNHWHTRKMERFTVIQGKAEMRIRRLFSDKVVKYTLSGDSPSFVDTNTFFVHSLENIGTDKLVTAFWANEVFNEDDPDSFQENVVLKHG